MTKKKIKIFVLFLISVSLSLTTLLMLPSYGSQRPNIVTIMLDDLDVGLLENALENGLMPNFKRWFIDQGLEFTDFNTTTPVCAPSRASYLTGQYAHNHNLVGFRGAEFDDSNTLPIWLSRAGYETAHIGKYLNGYGNGFRSDGSIPPGWSRWWGLIDPTTYRVFNFRISENGQIKTYDNGEYQTNIISDLAFDFIKNASDDKPFYLEVMPLAPHVEEYGLSLPNCSIDQPQRWGKFIRPDPSLETDHSEIFDFLASAPLPTKNKSSFNEPDISDKPVVYRVELERMSQNDINCLTNQYRTRLASLVSIDDMIAKIFSSLESKITFNNTLVIFTSDHGLFQGEHRLATKRFEYNEAIRTPLYFWYANQKQHSTIDALTINIDLPITIADLAGASPGLLVDGKSLKPLVAGRNIPWRDSFLIECVLNVNPGPLVDTSRAYIGLVTAKEKFVEIQPTREVELFDLQSDPLEVSNIAGQQPRRIGELRSFTNSLRDCAGEECFITASP